MHCALVRIDVLKITGITQPGFRRFASIQPPTKKISEREKPGSQGRETTLWDGERPTDIQQTNTKRVLDLQGCGRCRDVAQQGKSIPSLCI